MRTETHITGGRAVAISWLAAIAALGFALMLAVAGQALGALAGGCAWIGATMPLDRQVWALVNQPVLNFSSLPAAGGYWLGSMVVPLLAALLLLSLRSRKPGLVGQFVVIQTTWWIAVMAGVWLPLLDPVDGHLSRWLLLQNFGSAWVWTVPAVATLLAVGAALRLLEIARGARSDLGRGARVATLVVHLVLPVLGWLCLVYFTSGTPPLRPVLALAVPVSTVLVFGWFRYPPPFPRPLQVPSGHAVFALVAGVLLSAGVLWVSARPLPEGRAAGVLWGDPGSFNNIRPWVALPLPTVEGREED